MIDARGRSCPEPVIMTKKAMDTKEASYEVLVDNKVAVENVSRYARYQGYQVETIQDGDDYTLKMTRK